MSIDELVCTRVALARIGDHLRLDGLDSMLIVDSKKAIIKKVNPEMRLDGKSKVYIDAAFDLAADQVKRGNGTDRQRRQMYGGKQARYDGGGSGNKAGAARNKMMKERYGKGGKR